ncbi:tetratricopeptide repeat protein [Paraburkholderia ferrariae]|uniref:tetratricopeptide repeat protein n=1 Tax=Paraburkholderia ferrariae TaxID=386056 RepID=UPI0004834B6E|nr:tetratricopeptide repeat protein [Paraburkholderia ferrariae]
MKQATALDKESGKSVKRTRLPDWDSAELAIALSRATRLGGCSEEADAIVHVALQQYPRHVGLLVERARGACLAGERDEAHRWYALAWDVGSPEQMWVVDWLELMMALGHHDIALGVAEAHCRRAPDYAEGWFWNGYARQESGKLEQALDAYRRCARSLPRRPMLRNNMAAAYLCLGEYALAQALLEEAIGEEPANALVWTNLAAARLKQGDVEQALTAVERALELDPDYPLAQQAHSSVLARKEFNHA